MKKFMRIMALATLGLYISLVVTETFHVFCKDHVEATCAICQVAHQTPVISQGKPALQRQENIRRIVTKIISIPLAESETTYSGRSPPVL